nr:hypothetical protein CKG001_21820 [Bdellovibrio sp. CKG001]BFD66356.1 hypothetical protein HAGR004_13780 [Bdellovibrio sp. HAGR004]
MLPGSVNELSESESEPGGTVLRTSEFWGIHAAKPETRKKAARNWMEAVAFVFIQFVS